MLCTMVGPGYRTEIASTRFQLFNTEGEDDSLYVQGSIDPVEGGIRVSLFSPPSDVRTANLILGVGALGLLAVGLFFSSNAAIFMGFVCACTLLGIHLLERQGNPYTKGKAVKALEGAFAQAATLPTGSVLPPLLSLPRHGVGVREHFANESAAFVSAKVLGCSGLALEIEKLTYYPIGRSLGMEDTNMIGDPRFDDRFSLKANDVPFARTWLNQPICDQLLALVEYVELRLTGGQLHLIRSQPLSFDQHQQAVELARRIANRGRELYSEWQTMAQALDGEFRGGGGVWTPDGSTAIEVARVGVAVTIDGWQEHIDKAHSHLFTRLRCRRVGLDSTKVAVCARACKHHPEWGDVLTEIAVDNPSFDGAYFLRISPDAKNFLTAALIQQIEVCRPDRLLVNENEVTILFSGFESNTVRIKAACTLAAELATRGAQGVSSGPYR